MADLEYTVVRASSIRDLIDYVNLRVDNGWSLQGGVLAANVATAVFGNRTVYMQALVRAIAST
jgi:prolipoprotein diacylglyceryltransferase